MSFGRITKLKINVGKTQTHITYEKGATRLFSSNPSGFVFRSPSSKDIEHKQLSKQCAATIFLQRHFGTGGSIRKTPSVRMLLSALGLAESVSQTELQMAEEQQQQQQLPAKSEPTWYSCKLELLPAVVAQHAHSLVVPTGRLLLSCCGWHLQNCSERLAQTSNNSNVGASKRPWTA
ncbi:uncharacterized protein LOC108596058 isoform X2 [Drosophila busckii]|uniref:uncharacterized protein LOC108596058 isoform X2 n=1 Tax=Drosophila busckii TaxID=30019 RepID=UPI00083F1F6D|nr:uncharacterized protein LOC108596058 isoform X2 [Drosophila busckii]